MRFYFAIPKSKFDLDLMMDCNVPNMLFAYANWKSGYPDTLIKRVKAKRHTLMLDSGAFENERRPGAVTVQEYIDYLKDNRGLFREYVVLDDLRKRPITFRNYDHMRKEGLDPLFVDHLWFHHLPRLDRLYASGDKVCWGGTMKGKDWGLAPGAAAVVGERGDNRVTKNWVLKSKLGREVPRTKIHILGAGGRINTFEDVIDLVDSTDSASWAIMSGAFGKICWVGVRESGWPKMQASHHSLAPRDVIQYWRARNMDIHKYEDRRRAAILTWKEFARRIDRKIATLKAETERGLIISPDWMAEAVIEGTKTLIVKPHSAALELQGDWLLISARKALGRIRLGAPISMNRQGLAARLDDHLITPALLDAWGSEYDSWKTESFDAWPVEVLERFESPMDTDVPVGPQQTIPDVTLKASDPESYIERLPELAQGLSIVDFGRDQVEKLKVSEMDPVHLREVDDRELLNTNRRLHQLWGGNFKGNDKITVGNLNRESLVNAYIFVTDEMKRRGFEVSEDSDLFSEAAALRTSKEDSLATIRPGADSAELEPILLADVLPKFQTFKLRMPFLYLVGSLANRGISKNDVDIIVRGPVSEEMLHVLKFRLGRMLPPEISARLSVMTDELGGPFTNHVELADLIVEFRPSYEVKQMALAKQDDPLMVYPSKSGPRDAVFQYHFRGRGFHLDMRLAVADYLVGWTVALQRPGSVPPIDSAEEAKRIAGTFDSEGSKYSKPFVAPARVYATPKSRQPAEWINVDAREFKPGTVGATPEEVGVMVRVEKPNVEWGLQKPWFHEYFFSGSDTSGIIYFRQLVSDAKPADAEVEAGRLSPEGSTFWTMQMSKTALPSVLKKHAVDQKNMPPDGISAIPKTLEAATPKQFRYWEAKGEEARKIRDDLVASKWFTEENVQIVDNEFRRIESKRYIYTEGGEDYVAKAKPRFVLSWQYWRGPMVERFAPTMEIWHLMVESGNGVDDFMLQYDPLSSESSVSGTRRRLDDKASLDVEGVVEPGKKYAGSVWNETKETPSRVRIVDRGTLDVLEDNTFRFYGSKLKGKWEIKPEGSDTGFWMVTPLAAEKAVPVKDGVQIWDPENKNPDADRSMMRPLAIFKPMKPLVVVKQIEELKEKFASEEQLKGGIVVEPKWNGFSFVVEKSGDRVLSFTEDAKIDLLPNLPGLKAELEKIPGDFILVTEFMAVNEEGDFVPRRDLAMFRGKDAVDDSGVRLRIHDLLYRNGDNLTAKHLDLRKKALDIFMARVKKIGVRRLVESGWKAVHTWPELKSEYQAARRTPGSEGAMFKWVPSTYTLGGVTDSWAKIKDIREIRAVIYDRHEVKGAPGVYNFFCAVGPIGAKEKGEWKEIVEIGGKLYTPVGKTFSAKLNAKAGDVVRVEVTEIIVDPKSGQRSVHWFTPTVIDSTDQAPMTPQDVENLALPGEEKTATEKSAQYDVRLKVSKAEERLVYGIVLEPETVDAQGDIYSAEEIRSACHEFMEKFGKLGLQHKYLANNLMKVLECWIAPADLKIEDHDVKKGTWLLACRIVDEDLWQAVKEGKFTGFSIGGTARSVAG